MECHVSECAAKAYCIVALQRHGQSLPEESLLSLVAGTYGSRVIQWDLLPISSMKSVPAMLTGPRVSKAIGTNV